MTGGGASLSVCSAGSPTRSRAGPDGAPGPGGAPQGKGGGASAELQPVVERLRANPCRTQRRAAEAGGADPPGRLAYGSSDRVVGAGREGAEHREPERDRRAVDRDRGGALPGRGHGRRTPAIGEEPCREIGR